MKPITIAGTTVQPGEKGIARIPVARMPRGDQLELTVRIVNGAQPGPVLGLESGSHGDEAFALQTIHETVDSLNPQELKGAVLALPVCNPVAFETFTRLTGLGMTTEAVNMNTVFPGSADGAIVSQMAHAITQHYLPQLDYLIDFHSGGLESAIEYTLVRQSGGELSSKILELSKMFGADILSITHSSSDDRSSISSLAESMGIPAVVTMLGGSTLSSDAGVIERGLKGVRNVMQHLGMLEGEPTLNPNQVVLGDRKLIRHQQGGVFQPEVGFEELGTTVTEGTLIGLVRDPYTYEVLEEYRAPFEQTVLIMLRGLFGRVFPGDYAYIFGDASTMRSI